MINENCRLSDHLILTIEFTANATSIPSSCSISSGSTATAQSDLNQYTGCSKLSGDLLISGPMGNIDLGQIEDVEGSVNIFNSSNLIVISGNSLEKVSGEFRVEKMTLLQNLMVPKLGSVGSLTLITLPAISTLNTNLSSAEIVTISDTSLSELDALKDLKSVKVLNINNNKGLEDIDLDLESVDEALEISYNGRGTQVEFDHLSSANNITLRDVAKVTFPELSTVNSSLGFINNTFEELSIPLLKKVGGTFSLISNDDLSSVKFPNLTTVNGGFIVVNNTDLTMISGFSNLESVGGALNIIGNFSYLDLHSLRSVKGGADVETGSSNFSCDPLKDLQRSGGIQGNVFVCRNGATSTSIALTSTGSASSTGSATSSSTRSTSKSKGAAGHLAPATSFMGAVAAVAIALL